MAHAPQLPPPQQRSRLRHGEDIVAALAREILALIEDLAELDAVISEKVTERQHAQVLLSMPGFGLVLAAKFLGLTGWDLTVFQIS
jgi:transposase